VIGALSRRVLELATKRRGSGGGDNGHAAPEVALNDVTVHLGKRISRKTPRCFKLQMQLTSAVRRR
jgi:hypothetical protein